MLSKWDDFDNFHAPFDKIDFNLSILGCVITDFHPNNFNIDVSSSFCVNVCVCLNQKLMPSNKKEFKDEKTKNKNFSLSLFFKIKFRYKPSVVSPFLKKSVF